MKTSIRKIAFPAGVFALVVVSAIVIGQFLRPTGSQQPLGGGGDETPTSEGTARIPPPEISTPIPIETSTDVPTAPEVTLAEVGPSATEDSIVPLPELATTDHPIDSFSATTVALATEYVQSGEIPATMIYLYIVQPGDTLTSIAETTGATREELLALNWLSEDTEIPAGTMLLVPALQIAFTPVAAAQDERVYVYPIEGSAIMYWEPDQAAPEAGMLYGGEAAIAIGRTPDGEWIQVVYEIPNFNPLVGVWVAGDEVEFQNGSLEDLPEVTPTPTPTP